MKHSSKELLEYISRHCTNQLTYYRYNRHALMISDKYRSGRVTALNYVQELTLYYFRKENNLKEEFRRELDLQIHAMAYLYDGDYRRGIVDALHNVIDALERE